MRQLTRSFWLTAAGLLLALPTAIFICIAILKYQFGFNKPFDSVAPALEHLGISDPIGWNINLLILFGPLMGFVLAAMQIIKLNWSFSNEQFDFRFVIRKKWFPLFVAAFSISLLALLALYMFGENCNCPVE